MAKVSKEVAPSLHDDLRVLAKARPVEPRREVRCIDCGYGAVSVGPLRCPMCGGEAWDFVEWRPFQRGR